MEVSLRNALRKGWVDGPRFQAAGYHVSVSGGHGAFIPWNVARLGDINITGYGLEEVGAMYADGPNEWRKVVRLNVWNDVDLIKLVLSRDLISTGNVVQSQATLEEVTAAVEEAKACGKTVMCHVSGREGIMKAIKAGVDIITHGFFMDEECAALMAEKGIYWEPTNCYAKNMRDCAVDEVPEKLRKYFPNNIPEWAHENSIRVWEDRLENFKKCIDTGVKVLAGSDAGCPYVIHGLNAREMEISVSLGLSTRDALLGATKYAAESLGVEDELGTVEVGKLADLVVVDGNPLEDITVLQEEEKIKLVMRDGKVVVER